MASTIGKWNPAWGPEPEWRGPPAGTKLRWFKISCSCTGEEYMVRGYRGDRYHCTKCGAAMTVEPDRNRKGRGTRVPVVEVGQRYGRLVIIEVGPSGGHGRRVTCRCDCGQTKEVWAKHVRNGSTKSCGCLAREKAAERPPWDHPWDRSFQ